MDEVPASQNSMVHQSGTQIVDGKGMPLKLRGMNLGGWLLWEPWLWGGHLFASESGFMKRLAKQVGEAEAVAFRDAVYSSYIGEADIARIAELGFNVVRVPLNYRLFSPERGQAGWVLLDSLLDWCEKYKVYAVLDLHSAPGGQSFLFMADPGPRPQLWSSQEAKTRTVELWRALALRYKDRQIVAGYDLLNEPWTFKGQDLVDLYRRIISAIREVDPAHMVILEGLRFSFDFSPFQEALSANQAYGFHMYTWFGDDRLTWMERYRRLSQEHGVPLWCGEFGENSHAMIASTVKMYEDPHFGVSGWAFWTWKKLPGWFPGLTVLNENAAWKGSFRGLTSLHGLLPPDAATVRAGLFQFLEGIPLGRCQEDAAMLKALGL